MVGMSGKASEPRSGATGSSKKQPSVPGGHSRTQVSGTSLVFFFSFDTLGAQFSRNLSYSIASC